jgi:hypothetical protein
MLQQKNYSYVAKSSKTSVETSPVTGIAPFKVEATPPVATPDA